MSVAETAPMPVVLPRPRSTTEGTATTRGGGRNVVVPGIGVGRVVREAGPMVVEIDLPAPTAAVFVLGEGDQARTVVLADPLVAPRELTATMRAARVLAGRVEPGARRRRSIRGAAGAMCAAVLGAAGVAFAYSDLSPVVIELVGR